MNLIEIIVISLLNVLIDVNCSPIANRGRTSSARHNSSRSNSFNLRRRDIYVDNATRNRKDSDFASKLSGRSKVLLPDLDTKGRPLCLSSPDDTYCETVQNYPNATIRQEIDFSPLQFLEIFGTKDIDGRKSYIDDDLTEERVCRRVPKVIYPQMAKNQANQWIYVVNEVEYTQAVVAEICEKEGKSCAYLDTNLPPGMYSKCRQKYSYKRLLALHPTEKRTYSDKFKFPSCCACYVKSNDILGRTFKTSRSTSRRS